MGIGEGRGDSMDRKDLKKKKKEGREGEPQEEGHEWWSTLGGEDRCSWLTPPSGSLWTLAMTAGLVTCQGSLWSPFPWAQLAPARVSLKPGSVVDDTTAHGFPFPGGGGGREGIVAKLKTGVLRVCSCNGHKVVAGERGCLNILKVYTQRQDFGGQRGHVMWLFQNLTPRPSPGCWSSQNFLCWPFSQTVPSLCPCMSEGSW